MTESARTEATLIESALTESALADGQHRLLSVEGVSMRFGGLMAL